MMKTDKFPVAQIYAPVNPRPALAPARVGALAASTLNASEQMPINVCDKERRPGPGGPLSTSAAAR